ncbi:MAG: 4-(cytidine 5'-diphospho)-2-C-methyl-D-erythritol kinase [Clostridia bacterium]|nr:4-(cytidine 5'-diphospho)-2-C-methyl-D-erythritol kinase [Clostridia bacterium]
MADSVTVLAYAKLNLSLDITGVRPDGYHTIEMVMQSVNLHDTVTVTKAEEIKVTVSNMDELSGEDNIAYKAAAAFFEATEIDGGAAIKIKKRIPVAAGLGGGSADAAAVLTALNMLFDTRLSKDELCDIGLKIGADVPFCIVGGTQLAEGIGGILTPLPDLKDCAFVLIKNGEKPSTGEMYRRFDNLESPDHPDTSKLVESICEGDIIDACDYMANVFEPLWDSAADVKADLMENGAVTAVLSGSGPSIFGVFDDLDTAQKCKSQLQDKYDEIFVCKPVNIGVEED